MSVLGSSRRLARVGVMSFKTLFPTPRELQMVRDLERRRFPTSMPLRLKRSNTEIEGDAKGAAAKKPKEMKPEPEEEPKEEPKEETREGVPKTEPEQEVKDEKEEDEEEVGEEVKQDPKI